MTGGEGRVYLDGSLLVRESVSFSPDTHLRNVIMGQDEFKVNEGKDLMEEAKAGEREVKLGVVTLKEAIKGKKSKVVGRKSKGKQILVLISCRE